MICISEIRGSRAIPVQMTFTYGWTLDEGDDPTLIDLHPCYFVEDNCTGSLYRFNSRDNSDASDISIGSEDTI